MSMTSVSPYYIWGRLVDQECILLQNQGEGGMCLKQTVLYFQKANRPKKVVLLFDMVDWHFLHYIDNLIMCAGFPWQSQEGVKGQENKKK